MCIRVLAPALTGDVTSDKFPNLFVSLYTCFKITIAKKYTKPFTSQGLYEWETPSKAPGIIIDSFPSPFVDKDHWKHCHVPSCCWYKCLSVTLRNIWSVGILKRQGLAQSGRGGTVERRRKSNPKTRQWERGGPIAFVRQGFPRKSPWSFCVSKAF